MSKVLIGVHAYDGEVTGGRDFEDVMHDRLSEAFEFISKSSLGSFQVMVLGGEEVHSFLKRNFSEEFEKHDFLLTEKHENTSAEVDFLFRKSKELNTDICYSISSKDHVSRIVEYWAKKDREEVEAAVVPSNETYSQSEEEPVVVEAAVFEELRDVIAENLRNIDKDHMEEVSREIEQVFKKYEK